MEIISGLGKVGRERLAALIRGTKGAISVSEAADILNVPPSDASKMLARWANNGWLSRVRRGLYVPVPLESRTPDVPIEDPWIIAERLFAPCYIGGWSAAEYWDLTEQIFRTVLVMTTQKPRKRDMNIKGTNYKLRTVSERAMFGLKPVWRGQMKVLVSDAARTIVDLLSDPSLGGGIRPTVDMFRNYLSSDKKDMNLLIDYAIKLNNGAVFKRLGFLLERYAPDERGIIKACKDRLTAGYSKLDPKLDAERLITRWRLWVPKGWVKEN